MTQFIGILFVLHVVINSLTISRVNSLHSSACLVLVEGTSFADLSFLNDSTVHLRSFMAGGVVFS